MQHLKISKISKSPAFLAPENIFGPFPATPVVLTTSTWESFLAGSLSHMSCVSTAVLRDRQSKQRSVVSEALLGVLANQIDVNHYELQLTLDKWPSCGRALYLLASARRVFCGMST